MICILIGFKRCKIIIATGLSQTPFEETKFYYRLKKHKEFLSLFNIEYKDIFPRMTRDLLTFSSSEEALKAQKDLEQFKVDDGSSLFGEMIMVKFICCLDLSQNDRHQNACIF